MAKDIQLQLSHLIHYVPQLLDARAEHLLQEKYHISYDDYYTLLGVFYCNGENQQVIAAWTRFSKSYISKKLYDFEQRELIVVSRSKTDRRQHLISLTKTGEDYINELETFLKTELEQITHNSTIYDASVLKKQLIELVSLLS